MKSKFKSKDKMLKNSILRKEYARRLAVKTHARKTIERATGKLLAELKKEYSEDKLFFLGLKHITTTKKIICKALNIPVEAGCRYKRKFEKDGLLVQSIKSVYCPYTRHLAHELTTNEKEFERLLNIDSEQLKLFKNEK